MKNRNEGGKKGTRERERERRQRKRKGKKGEVQKG